MTTLADVMPEAMLQKKATDYATHRKWLWYHPYDSRRSVAGFPDVVFVRGRRVIFAEFKSARGKVSRAQRKWRDALLAAGAEYYLWRPADWPEIEKVLA